MSLKGFEGPAMLQLTNDNALFHIDVETIFVDNRGVPIYIVDVNGIHYNWQHVLVFIDRTLQLTPNVEPADVE